MLALIAGIGGAAAAFSWFDPFRPYLIVLTGVVLAFAWYQKLTPRKDSVACDCEGEQQKKPFIQSKLFLGIVSALALLLLTFPYYSAVFFPEPEPTAIPAAVAQPLYLQQVQLEIKGMTCGGCESSVNHALSSKKGVLEAKASYEGGMARVTYDPTLVTPEALKQAVEEEVGYTVTNIQLISSKEE